MISVDITEVDVFLVRPVLKGMTEATILQTSLASYLILLLVLHLEVEAQEDHSNGHSGITPKVDAKGYEIPRGVVSQEHLRAYAGLVYVIALGVLYMCLPIAFPTAHDTNVAATTTDFLVAPPMFRDTMDRHKFWADQNERVM